MVSAINNAINGLNNAGKLLEVSAKRIAEANTQNTQSADPLNPSHDITNDLINTKIASYSFKANLKVIQAVDNNFKSLLDIKT